MTASFRAFVRDDRGAAAAEMALALPILVALIFGAFELGNFFMAEHRIIKAVRDGARFASRQSFLDYAGCTVSTDVRDDTRNVTRFGAVEPAVDASPRLGSWTDPNSITVSVACDSSGDYSGIYSGSSIGAPVVTVAASVPYEPLIGTLGITDASITLTARSQATVNGI